MVVSFETSNDVFVVITEKRSKFKGDFNCEQVENLGFLILMG